MLPAGEQVLFVYDAIGAGAGFIGVTDRRVVIQDNSFVGNKTALTSVPYARVNAVPFVSVDRVTKLVCKSSSRAGRALSP